MRIGYLVPEFPGQTHIFFWREIKALREAGAQVALISTRRPGGPPPRHDFVSAAVGECHYLFPPDVRNVVAWLKSDLLATRGAFQYLRHLFVPQPRAAMKLAALLASAIDLLEFAKRDGLEHIHVQSCADAAHVAALCRWMGGPPYSLVLHGDLKVYGEHHALKMERAAFVGAVGTHLRDQLEASVGLSRDRVLVTWMGLETRRLAQAGANRDGRRGSLHLVTVARLNAMKGHLHALAAVKRAVDAGLDIRYTIAGEGTFRTAIEDRIRELGLESRVQLVGTLGEAEVFELLSRADAFVLPSYGAGEAWPVSVMEGMAAGLPVISSVIGATPEMITPGVDGLLVPQRDEDALTAAVTSLANDPELRRRLGDKARVTAASRFDVAATAGRLLSAMRGAR
jgi:colanic acid/amylovoran biosynthesis glycosyltransferase